MAKLPRKQTKRKNGSIKKILLKSYNRKTMNEAEIIEAKYDSIYDLKKKINKLGESISSLEKLEDTD